MSGQNIAGVTLNMVPTVARDIHGTLVCEGGVKPEQIQIALQRTLSNTRLMAKVEEDGSFVIPGVWPGKYRATASSDSGRDLDSVWGRRDPQTRSRV